MLPTLAPGDQVFVAQGRTPVRGDIVVARHPFKTDIVLIKRVGQAGGRVELLSDNPAEGSDSRTLGRVDAALVYGVVIARV